MTSTTTIEFPGGDTAPLNHTRLPEDAAPPVWAQMSTVGVGWTSRLAAEAARQGDDLAGVYAGAGGRTP